MMRISILFFLIAACFLGSCSQEETSSTNESSSSKTEAKSLDTVRIEETGPTSYELKIGQLISYSYIEFISTGAETQYSTSNDVLVLKDKIYNAKYPSESDITGGDETLVTLVYEAKKQGSCHLNVNHLYRKDLERRLSFLIKVKE